MLVILTIALPHSENTTDAGIIAAGLVAVLVAAGLLRNDARMSVRALQLVVALGVVLITACVVYGGDSADAYPFMYLWVSLYAYYFFSPTVVSALIAWCAGLYAVAFLFESATRRCRRCTG